MKRLLVAVVVLLFFCVGVLALFWFGNYFSSYVFSRDRLSVEKPVAQTLSLGTQTVLNLHGVGFNRETSVSLFMNVSNNEAVIGSLPLGGIYNESLLYGDFLYLARDEGGVQVLNIKNPQQPQLLNEYLIGRTIVDIHQNGNYLFLCCGRLGVAIMRISQNGLLDHVADIVLGTTARKSQFIDGFLYVAAGSGGLLIYDVRQPEQVELVKVVKPGLFISKMAVSGSYLYLVVAEKLIEIYQLAEPQLPLLVGSLKLSAKLSALATHRQQLYVATKNGVSLYRLASSGQPELLNQWAGFGSARKIFSGLERVYISDSFSGLRIVGPEVEASPDLINLDIDPRTLVETADYLFVAGSDKGLLIIDKDALLSRQVVKTINTPGSARDLFIKDHWMYVADGRAGVLLQDLTAAEVNFTTISSRWGESFVVHRELLFVAEAKWGIEVFDISAPGQTKSVATWPNLKAMRLAVVANYLVTAKGAGGVELIDIADIQHPVVMDILSDVHALDVISDGHLIYIPSKNKGLLVYEITDDFKFNRLSRLLTPFPMNHFDLTVSVQVQNGIAYVANGRAGLLIVDISKPAKPIILSSIDIPGICKQVRVVNKKAFITSHRGGINVVNIEDPENPILLNSISIQGLSRGLQVVDGLIYVTQREMGVTVVPVPAVAEKVNLISERQMKVTLPSPKFSGRYGLQISDHRDLVIYDGVVTYQ